VKSVLYGAVQWVRITSECVRRLAKIEYQENDSDIVSKSFPHGTRKHKQAGVDTVSPPVADCPHHFLQPLELSWPGGVYCIPIPHEDVLQNVLRTVHRRKLWSIHGIASRPVGRMSKGIMWHSPRERLRVCGARIAVQIPPTSICSGGMRERLIGGPPRSRSQRSRGLD